MMESATLGKTNRQSAGDEALMMLAGMVERLKSIASSMGNKLSPICNEPAPEINGEGRKDEQWPPYFQSIRGYVKDAEGSLNWIEDILRRAEI